MWSFMKFSAAVTFTAAACVGGAHSGLVFMTSDPCRVLLRTVMNRAATRWTLPEFLEPPVAARNVLSSQTCKFRELWVGLISALPGGAASCEDGEIRRRRLDPCWR